MEFEMKCYAGAEPRILVTKEFVERNGFAISVDKAMEIVCNPSDLFGFDSEVAVEYLPYDKGTEIWSEEYMEKIEQGEVTHSYISDIREATQDFLDYMVFAWMKAMDERGLSASRSIVKLTAWMKILGRDDVSAVLEDERLYRPYGRPALRRACEMLGIECPEYL